MAIKRRSLNNYSSIIRADHYPIITQGCLAHFRGQGLRKKPDDRHLLSVTVWELRGWQMGKTKNVKRDACLPLTFYVLWRQLREILLTHNYLAALNDAVSFQINADFFAGIVQTDRFGSVGIGDQFVGAGIGVNFAFGAPVDGQFA